MMSLSKCNVLLFVNMILNTSHILGMGYKMSLVIWPLSVESGQSKHQSGHLAFTGCHPCSDSPCGPSPHKHVWLSQALCWTLRVQTLHQLSEMCLPNCDVIEGVLEGESGDRVPALAGQLTCFGQTHFPFPQPFRVPQNLEVTRLRIAIGPLCWSLSELSWADVAVPCWYILQADEVASLLQPRQPSVDKGQWGVFRPLMRTLGLTCIQGALESSKGLVKETQT